MFKNGQWVKWDGGDVKQLIVEEQITLKEAVEHYGYKAVEPLTR